MVRESQFEHFRMASRQSLGTFLGSFGGLFFLGLRGRIARKEAAELPYVDVECVFVDFSLVGAILHVLPVVFELLIADLAELGLG